MHRRPLGAIHGRGASTVGGGAGVEQHLGLAGEAVLGAQAVLSVYQGQPLAAAVGIETRGVQRACVQQIAVGARIGSVEAPAGDEFVDVLAAGVVARIEGHAPVLALSLIHIWHYPWEFDPFDVLACIDYGDCHFDHGTPQHTPAAIEAHATRILEAGAAMLTLGGDHFISYPLLKAHAKKHGRLALIHFDAHSDTWPDEEVQRLSLIHI